MATLYVTEYEHIALAPDGTVPVGEETRVADQTVAIGGASVASAAFHVRTNFVRLHTDAICSVMFGTAPVATTAKSRMAANQTEYFGVPQSQSYKVAVITNT